MSSLSHVLETCLYVSDLNKAEPFYRETLGLPLDELPSIMLLAGGAGRQLAAPYTVETVLADVVAALPEVKTACSADEFHRFVRAGRQGRPAVLALAPGAARTSLRALCAGEQLACAVVPHARCSLLGGLQLSRLTRRSASRGGPCLSTSATGAMLGADRPFGGGGVDESRLLDAAGTGAGGAADGVAG